MSKYGASIYNFLFNSVNSLIVIINGIIMVPLYFHYFPVSVYGAWLASGNLVAMIGLLESGFSGVITQKMATALSKGDNVEYRILAGANIISAVLLSSCIFLLSLFLSPFIADIVNVESDYRSDIIVAFVLSGLSSAIMVLVSLFGAFPQVWQETKCVGYINTICNIVAIVSLIIYLFMGLGVISLGLSYVTRSLLNLIMQGRWIYRRNKKRNDGAFLYKLNSIKQLVRDCFYPFISKIASVFMGQSTSLVIAAFLNPALAAVYDLTSKITVVLMSILSAANGSFFALFSLTISRGNKVEIESVINKVTCFVSCLIVFAIIVGACFSKPIIALWVGLDKFGGIWLLVTIVFATAINQYKSFFNSLLFSAGLIDKSSKIDIASLVTYLVCLNCTLWCFKQYAIPLSLALTNGIFLWVYLSLFRKYVGISLSVTTKYIFTSLFYSSLVVMIYLLFDIGVSKWLYQGLFLCFSICAIWGYIWLSRDSREALISTSKKIFRS